MAGTQIVFVGLVFVTGVEIAVGRVVVQIAIRQVASRRLTFGETRIEGAMLPLGVRIVRFTVRVTARGLASVAIGIPATTTAATAAAAARIVEILRGHRLFQRFTLIRFGDRGSLDGIDDLIDMFAFVGKASRFATVGRLAMLRARRRLAVAAATTATTTTAPATGFVFGPAGRRFTRALVGPFLVLGQYQLVHEVGRYHLVGEQFFGGRFGESFTFVSAARTVVSSPRPFASLITPAAFAAASTAPATVTAALFLPITAAT